MKPKERTERMMRTPVVAIVGRPNVGKSTLFNRMIGARSAIVESTPGATRDRNYGRTEWNGRAFTVIDTGGFEPEPIEGDILEQMRQQALIAVEEADLVVLLGDGKEGVLPQDEWIARFIRRSFKPVICAVNKIDDTKHEERMHEFHSLGFEHILPVSAEHGRGVAELMDLITDLMPEGLKEKEESREEPGTRVAIVGRPNVGKSSLVNRILGQERLVVHPTPGTTRDSIDTRTTLEGKDYTLIDTAGIRKRGKVIERLERYSVIMALKSIDRCDVAVLLLDATEGVSGQDMKIADYIMQAEKACIIVVNKWDLIEEKAEARKEIMENISEKLKFIYKPHVLFLSALTGKGAGRLLPAVDLTMKEYSKRIPTGEINSLMAEMARRHPPPLLKGRAVKLLYGTQVGTRPPRFIIFTNHPEGIRLQYYRYLQNSLRERYGFNGCPLVIHFKKKR